MAELGSNGNQTLGLVGVAQAREGRAAERGSICKNGERIMTTFTTSVQILMHHLRKISDDAVNICHTNTMGQSEDARLFAQRCKRGRTFYDLLMGK